MGSSVGRALDANPKVIGSSPVPLTIIGILVLPPFWRCHAAVGFESDSNVLWAVAEKPQQSRRFFKTVQFFPRIH